MSDFFHGVEVQQEPTSVSTPVTAASGITFAVGTAPVHVTGGGDNVNRVIRAGTNADAVRQLGYSDGWDKYGLSEVIFSHFRLYQTAPVFFVNVLDPAIHKKTAAPEAFPVTGSRVLLPFEAIKESVTVQTYAEGTDYALFYSGDNLILEILDGGSVPAGIQELTIGFDEVDPSMVTKADIIGGFDIDTKKSTGLELIDSVFPAFRTVPDIIIAPGWSHDSEVAAVMSAKAASINGIFKGMALIDVDTNAARHYSDVPAWKKAQNIFSKTQILLYPKVSLGGRVFHLSTQTAGLMARTDSVNNGVPSQSPSNNSLEINSAVLADGTEVLLDEQSAGFLNANGIVTALNSAGGFVLWGNNTACFPDNTDVKDFFIPVTRMFSWVGNSIILTYRSRVDEKMTYRFALSIVDSLNIWLNGLRGEGHLLGGRVELPEDLNTEISLASGKVTFKVFMTPPSPAQHLLFILEYDSSYLSAIFG
ncbi:MAG: phage tail protein [Oscillospiraceae bacterium]|nr:phage tail protein [Oscillospiraceae bacterium]